MNTMTTPVSPGFQASCFLSKDPPRRMKTLPPPSTLSKLPPLNQTHPLSTISTLRPPQRSLPPPCHQMMLPPNIETPLPPNIETPRTSESIGLEALPSSPQMIRVQMIRRKWLSGAAAPCLLHHSCADHHRTRDEQHALEFLLRTILWEPNWMTLRWTRTDRRKKRYYCRIYTPFFKNFWFSKNHFPWGLGGTMWGYN